MDVSLGTIIVDWFLDEFSHFCYQIMHASAASLDLTAIALLTLVEGVGTVRAATRHLGYYPSGMPHRVCYLSAS